MELAIEPFRTFLFKIDSLFILGHLPKILPTIICPKLDIFV